MTHRPNTSAPKVRSQFRFPLVGQASRLPIGEHSTVSGRPHSGTHWGGQWEEGSHESPQSVTLRRRPRGIYPLYLSSKPLRSPQALSDMQTDSLASKFVSKILLSFILETDKLTDWLLPAICTFCMFDIFRPCFGPTDVSSWENSLYLICYIRF